MAEVGRLRRTSADAEARALLAKAAVLEREDDHEQAAGTYKLVAGRPAGEVSEKLGQRAKLGQIRAETAALEEEHNPARRFWDWIKGPLETVAEWLLYAFLILGAIGLLVAGRWAVRRLPPADRTALALEDLTAPTNERNARNRVLTRELMTSIKSFGVGGGDSSSAEIDETPDLDGTLLVNLKVVGTGLEAFESTIHDETPLKVGFVSFSPRQLLSLGALYFRRRSKQELTGSLATVGTRALLAVDLAGGDPTKPSRWAAVAKGADARSEVLEDMATRIVLDFGGSQVSTNWQSFRSYRSAMSDADEAAKNFGKREESLQAARHAFQRALDHDPANLLARFNLSNVLRKLGDNEAAVEHYAFLERLVENSDPERNAAAGLLLEKHADFLYIVRYNRAAALAKIDDWECHNKAIELLETLIVDAATLPKQEDRSRFQLLVRATWSSALVFELEQSRHDQRSDRRNAIVHQIEDVRDFVEQFPAEEVPEWTTYVTARATVQNALGRAFYLVGEYDQANEAFERALSMMADFGDARVNLASLLIREKGKYPRWVTRAEDHLKRALELSPHDRKARYLLGLLYREPAVNRLKEAKEEFAKVDDSRSLSQLAQINEREGDLAAATASMRRSIYRSPEPDYRTELYLKWLLRLHGQTSQSRETLQDAIGIGEKHVKATRGAQKEAATRLRDRLKQALAELDE